MYLGTLSPPPPPPHNNHRKSGTFMNQNHSIYRLLITCLWHFIIVIIIKARPTIAQSQPTSHNQAHDLLCGSVRHRQQRLKINLFTMNYYSFCRKLLHRIILHWWLSNWSVAPRHIIKTNNLDAFMQMSCLLNDKAWRTEVASATQVSHSGRNAFSHHFCFICLIFVQCIFQCGLLIIH